MLGGGGQEVGGGEDLEVAVDLGIEPGAMDNHVCQGRLQGRGFGGEAACGGDGAGVFVAPLPQHEVEFVDQPEGVLVVKASKLSHGKRVLAVLLLGGKVKGDTKRWLRLTGGAA